MSGVFKVDKDDITDGATIEFGNGIMYVPRKYCSFVPEEYEVRFDSNGDEFETANPSEYCDCFVCSECGYPMMYGDMGWFETEYPYKPNFKFCPWCGSKVVDYGV